jgi:hypothetical protein
MSDWTPFKDIVGYLDELHTDISQFVVLMEKMMLDKGYISLPTAGNQSNYSSVSSDYRRPEKWRAPYITRMFVLEEEELPSRSLFYLIMLKTYSTYDFPAVICGIYDHEPMPENRIWNKVYLIYKIQSMVASKPKWKNLRLENGWCVGEPDSKLPVLQVHGYILNLFDLSDRQKVIENIVEPLTRGGDQSLELTVPKYVFPPLKTDVMMEQA